MTPTSLVKPEIQAFIDARQWGKLREALEDWPPPELADLLLSVELHDRVLLFRALRREMAAEAFSHLDPGDQEELLAALTDQETRSLLHDIAPDDRTELLEELPGQVTRRLLNLLSPEDLAEARQLLGYPEESVGRLMTPDYLAVHPEWSVEESIAHIRQWGQDRETVNRVYVVDVNWKLLDDLTLRKLILADPEARITDLMDESFVSVAASDDREDAVRIIQRYDQVALPVVDSGGILLGIVTVDDLLDVAEEEATEDFHQISAVAPLRMGYWEATLWTLYRTRIGWLAILVFVNLISAEVMAAFEDTLTAMVTLAFFIPMVIATGGNAGTQSATILIRALSTEDVLMKEWWRVFLREALVGITIGVTIGILGGSLGLFRGGWDLAAVVMLTMVVMLLITNLLGMTLPFLFARFGGDPAVASGPLVTTIADVVGLLIYFSIAAWILGI